MLGSYEDKITYGPSTRYAMLFWFIFNEFVLALEVINTIVMNSKYSKKLFSLVSLFMCMIYVLRKEFTASFGVANVVVQAIVFINKN